ncbi:MAG: UDP-glucose 4-epimerase GalE [Erysipelotrichaceae bacterium]|jgi:UDP-glucose 4-epimerase|nr:UDP-glucose 4-epimerase GalE [Erysipelotrichaceae bacterium]
MHILVTGGTGYIGSHTVVELLQQGDRVTIIDNLYNSSKKVVDRIEAITKSRPDFVKLDLCDQDKLENLFKISVFDAVIHFAGYKAVGESVERPLMYYRNNLISTLNLLTCMKAHQVTKLVFSSSATVYGQPERIPMDEDCRLSTTNPYGTTKLMIETILSDVAKANPEFSFVVLRYFNPIGAHKSGLIGETPQGIPNNLTPYIAQVATGQRDFLRVWGNDYDTPDGTGVRDYIHVVDLAKGHLKALDYANTRTGIDFINLGTGKGYSVLQVLHAFEKACGKQLPYQILERRPGDIATSYASTKKAEEVLGWKAQYDIDRMCVDLWRFATQNPKGIR